MKTKGRPTTLTPESRSPRMQSYYRYYDANKAKQREIKLQRKLALLQTFERRECSSCGYSRSVAALDFHHPDGRDIDVSTGVFYGEWETAKAEVAKCVILCSNCHREIHATIG